jgi:hypothetical protein
MTPKKSLVSLLAAAVALLLCGCAIMEVKVTRFHRLLSASAVGAPCWPERL